MGLPYFKAYDVRGTVPDQVNPGVAGRVARAFAEWSRSEEVLVGRDARLSSPALAEAVIGGLLDAGVTVHDVGLVSTPMLNFAVARRRRHGMMVTASHNPKHYNGIKFIDPNAEQIYYGRGLEAIEALVAASAEKGRPAPSAAGGHVVLAPVLQEYEEHLVRAFRDAGLAARSAVVDCSNGVGGLALGMLERLGLRYTLLYHVPDGNFPNHECDTLRPKNLDALRRTVVERKADLGIMFDGDADRVAFVDEQGAIAPVDLIFVLLARQELERGKGRVFYDLRFSRTVKEEIERLGGRPVTMRVGNPFYKEAIHRHADGLLAAELSGHIMYREHFGIDDSLFAALKLLSYLARRKEPLSALLAPLRRWAGSGELRIRTERPADVIAAIRSAFPGGTVEEIDGVTLNFADWWINVRPSNTEPVVKLVMEAAGAGLLAGRMDEMRAVVARAGGTIEH
ncbi:MAG: phosphomannomutase/phosphoglucomutase [Nitrospirota bacterium]